MLFFVRFSNYRRQRGIPWQIIGMNHGIYPMDHLYKTRFMHLYYSYSRLLFYGKHGEVSRAELWFSGGNCCHRRSPRHAIPCSLGRGHEQ